MLPALKSKHKSKTDSNCSCLSTSKSSSRSSSNSLTSSYVHGIYFFIIKKRKTDEQAKLLAFPAYFKTFCRILKHILKLPAELFELEK